MFIFSHKYVRVMGPRMVVIFNYPHFPSDDFHQRNVMFLVNVRWQNLCKRRLNGWDVVGLSDALSARLMV